MATFVIVHGAWGGGWEWSGVARALRAHGHEVHTPTLTGLGDRAHLGGDTPVGLSTHVADVVAAVEFEDLAEVILCGASYGGMPVAAATERLEARVRGVVYIDALVPHDGERALDLLPSSFGAAVLAGVEANGAAWRVPLPEALRDVLVPPGSVPDGVRAAYLARCRDHPAASFVEPVRLRGTAEGIPHAFVRCTSADLASVAGSDPVEASAGRAVEAGWTSRELATRHDPQLHDPAGISAVLDELARAW